MRRCTNGVDTLASFNFLGVLADDLVWFEDLELVLEVFELVSWNFEGKNLAKSQSFSKVASSTSGSLP